MWDQKRGPTAANQLWYEDQQGILRSKLNGFSIDASGEGRTPKIVKSIEVIITQAL